MSDESDAGLVRVRYQRHVTEEYMEWCTTGLMGIKSARMLVRNPDYINAEIVLDEPGFPLYEGSWEEVK